MDDKQLLDMAMGVNVPKDLEYKNYWERTDLDRREMLVFRREARRAIYDYRKFSRMGVSYQEDRGLFYINTYILPNIDNNIGMSLQQFTFSWDIHPTLVTQMIRKEKWATVGGRWDENTGACVPTAFTEQE